MRKTWISRTLFCSARSKRRKNKQDNKDTIMLSTLHNGEFKRFEKDFDLDYISEVGREECERIAMDEFILL